MQYAHKVFLLFIIASASIPAISAIDPIVETYNDTFSGPADFWGNALAQADDGAYLVAGGSILPNTSLPDAFIWRSAEDWWYRTYGWEQGEDLAVDVIPTEDGCVFAGFTNTTVDGTYDAWVVKLDRNGTVQWSRLFRGAGDDGARSIVNAPDGGYTFAGLTQAPGTDRADAWVVHLDANGTEVWNRTYGGAGDDSAYDIVLSLNGYLVIGAGDSFTSGDYDAWVLSLDPFGDVLWSRTFGGNETDEYAVAGTQTTEDILLAGWTHVHGENESEALADAYVVRLGLDGAELWNQTFGGPGWDEVSGIRQVQDGYIAVGTTAFSKTYGDDAWIVQLANNGSVAWTYALGELYNDGARSLIRTADGLAFTGILEYASPTGDGAKRAAWIVAFEEAATQSNATVTVIPTATAGEGRSI